MKKKQDTNIKIIEATMVGPQKNLQLVKVGQEYLLIGVTKDRITFIKEIDKDSIKVDTATKMEQGIPFSKHLEDLIKKKKKSS